MLLIPICSDRTARKIDKHVLSVPLTLMMGRRYFLCRLQFCDRWFESNHIFARGNCRLGGKIVEN